MTEKWAGKVAVVTGCASGIGAAVFKDFVKTKIITIGIDIHTDGIKEKIASFGDDANGFAFGFHCDIANSESVKSCFKLIEDQFGVVNILVNCAGIGRKAEILDDNDDSFDKMNQVIDVNFRGVLQCTREAFRLMKKSDAHGIIININSVAGHKTPLLDVSLNVYGPTKYAITGLNEAIRHELLRAGNKKIRISSISPGIVDSDFIRASGYTNGDGNENVFEEIPMLKPEAISSGVMFVLSTPFDVSVSELVIRSTGERE